MANGAILAGRKYGRLGVLELVGRDGEGRRLWRCACDCGSGAIVNVSTRDLRSSRVESCGCLKQRIWSAAKVANTTHGQSKSRIYRIWQAMRNRCRNDQSPAFGNYGGRGITVCERWSSFENFLFDMGHPPRGTSIERINNEVGYNPENCRWANRVEQARNRRTNKFLTYEGISKTQQEWAELFGVSRERISHRLKLGWSVKDALERPIRATRVEY